MEIIGWILLGDKAACGGVVVEGHPCMSHDGVPFSFQGARVACQKNCTIMEGYEKFTMPGGNTAVHHGQLTSGGCPLQSSCNDRNGIGNDSGAAIPTQFIQDDDGVWRAHPDDASYELSYVVKDELDAQPIPGADYKLTLPAGRSETGATDSHGHTAIVSATGPQAERLHAVRAGDSGDVG